MAKRGADKQLTDQNWERDASDDEDNNSTGVSRYQFRRSCFQDRRTGGISRAKVRITIRYVEARETHLRTTPCRIRGLPQRKGAGGATPATPTTTPSAAPTPSPFGGLSGFGAAPNTTTSNPFAGFGSTPAASTEEAPAKPNPFATTNFSFASTAPSSDTTADKPATLTAPATGFSFSFGGSSFGASSTTTPSAPAPSFGSGSTSAITFGSTPKPEATKPSTNGGSDTTTPALTYYLGLRGLNVSLLDALTKEIERDPFINLAGKGFEAMKQKYESLRNTIEADYIKAGGKVSNGFSSASTTSMPCAAAPAPKPVEDTPKSTPPAASVPAPPAPPAAFSWGGSVVEATSATSSSSTPVTGGFVFKPDAPKDPYAEKSGFSFPASTAPPTAAPSSVPSTIPASSATSSSSIAAPKPSQDASVAKRVSKLANAPSAPSPLRFGESVSPPISPVKDESEGTDGTEKKTAEAKVPKKDYSTIAPPAPFSFGGSFGSIAKSGTEAAKDKPATSAPAFSFGSSSAAPASTPTTTAASSSAPPPAFSFNTPIKFGSSAPAQSKPAASPPLATTFGAGSPPSFGFGAALGKPLSATSSTSSAGFSFGVGSTSGFSFGAGAPAFGATSTTGSSLTPAFSFGSAPASTTAPGATPSFSFGASTTSTPAPPVAATASTESTTDDSTPITEHDDGLETKDLEPAEGEEDETTLAEARGKAYEMTKAGENNVLAVVNLFVKERKDDEGKLVKRVLARNDTSKAVVINFRLHSGFSVKLEKMFLTFQGFSGSHPKIYRVRFKGVTEATEFKDALEKAVQGLK
ncbi:BQ2448_6282 [Microbotryum intermedium]|uniref:BQ2448_6282 protein n=1 Tax=Microbotryum intermedium TaxID=269621 RepID=A0A238FJ92_9BASI|nr:BQ2448_6282 [Microbotryum intermedium]